jgi:hypothetical protein
MIRKSGLVGFLLLMIGPCLAMTDGDVLDKIRHGYAMLDAPAQDNPTNPGSAFDRTVFAPGFLSLWKGNQKCWDENGEGVQVWVWGQDIQLSKLAISVAKETTDEKTVRATFANFNDEQVWDYVFRRHGDGWLVDDVLQSGSSLAEIMAKGCSR